VVVCAGVHSRALGAQLGDRLNVYPVKGYSITVMLNDEASQAAAPQVSLLDDETKLVTSRLGADRFRVAGTAEFNGIQPRHPRRPHPPAGELGEPVLPRRQHPPRRALGRPAAHDAQHAAARGPRPPPNVFYNTGHGHAGLDAVGHHRPPAGEVRPCEQSMARFFVLNR
jgi:D-amino-acid dehydrogenase